MKIRALSDRVVLKRDEKKLTTSTGLLLPSGSVEQETIATVVSCGVDTYEVKPGNKVLYKEYSAIDVSVDGEELLIIKEEDIIAVLEDK